MQSTHKKELLTFVKSYVSLQRGKNRYLQLALFGVSVSENNRECQKYMNHHMQVPSSDKFNLQIMHACIL